MFDDMFSQSKSKKEKCPKCGSTKVDNCKNEKGASYKRKFKCLDCYNNWINE
jgi:transposase-like protein